MGVDMRREKTIYLTMTLLIAGSLACLIDISHRMPPPLPAQFGQLGTVLLALGAAAGLLAYIHVRRQWRTAHVHDDLVSRVSHELRTPLASIRAYAEMLIDGEVRDEKTARASYEIIQSEATRLSRLVDNVLNLARIQAGKEQIIRCPVSISALCRKNLEVIAPQAGLKSIEIVAELRAGLPSSPGRPGSALPSSTEFVGQCGEVHPARRPHNRANRRGCYTRKDICSHI